MKYDEAQRTPPKRLGEAEAIGRKLHELRIAHGMTQSEAAARAGISRSTAVLLEQGNESRTLSQVLRYLHAIEPELSLLGLLHGDSGAVRSFNNTTRVQRVSRSRTRNPSTPQEPDAKYARPSKNHTQLNKDNPSRKKSSLTTETSKAINDKYDF